MFNAYYDTRRYLKFRDQALIRIMTFINPPNALGGPKPFCQIWFDGIDDPIISEAYEMVVLWPDGWGLDGKEPLPYLVTCKNPLLALGLEPDQVSLVENKCDVAINLHEIIHNLPMTAEEDKKELAICAKLYNFQDDTNLDFKIDKSLELVEWIETQLILGVSKIIFHVRDVHAAMMRVLKFYAKQGKVDIEYLTMPDGIEAFYVKKDTISFNDCLYKNMYRFKYLLPIDIDEIFLPTKFEDKTLPDFIKRIMPMVYELNPNGVVNFMFRTAFFFIENNGQIQADAPSNYHYLQYIYRSMNFTKSYVPPKSIINAESAVVIYNYHAKRCFRSCATFIVEPEEGKIQHYSKHGCGDGYTIDECQQFRQDTVKDETLWKHKNEIFQNVTKTVEDLKTFEV